MATPTADKLRVYFPSKHLAADGDPLPAFTADGGTLTTIVDAALSQADDYQGQARYLCDLATIYARSC